MTLTQAVSTVDHEVQNLLEELIDQIHLISSVCDQVSVQLLPRHHRQQRTKKNMTRSTTSKQKKKVKIFSSSEDDSSSSSSSADESFVSEDNRTLVNEDSDDDDEQKVLRTRQGPRTRNELTIEELPPIENLTITLSDETPIELLGHVRHIVDGKLIVIEALYHSPPLNDDSVLFNRDRRSIGLIFETFGAVERPYYSIRYNDIESSHRRQIELNQEVFYAPKETTYTKYVFVQELRALKGSDASWEDDNEPPKFAIDYSDDEQEREAKSALRGKRNIDDSANDSNVETMSVSSFNSQSERGRGRGRGRQRGGGGGAFHRPAPTIPNWFQNTSNPTTTSQTRTDLFSEQPGRPAFFSTRLNNSNVAPSVFSSVTQSETNNPNLQSTQENNSNNSIFPWM